MLCWQNKNKLQTITHLYIDNLAKKDVTYSLFGPWESDPNKNILNFKAPLGQAIYNMEVGETRKFNINGVDYDYTVKSIEVAEFWSDQIQQWTHFGLCKRSEVLFFVGIIKNGCRIEPLELIEFVRDKLLVERRNVEEECGPAEERKL